jgi:ribosomal protein S18 acetylase RimI-like enzyme
MAAADIEPLLSREVARWRQDLAWDVEEAWYPIEPARASGVLPGFVVRAGAAVRGWTWFLEHRQVLQIAALVSDSEPATAAILEEILRSPESAATSRQVACVRDGAPGLHRTFERHGFAVAPYHYLLRDLSGAAAAGAVPSESRRLWTDDDLDDCAALCARAYAASSDVRAFAPGGQAEEWTDYVKGLVRGCGCGRLIQDASFVVAGDDGLTGAVLTADLGMGTAHITQVVVDPASRRRGVGRGLVDAALTAVGALGFARMSLLVSATNTRALRLYESLGFLPRAGFVVAHRVGPQIP